MPITKEDSFKVVMDNISGVKEQEIMKGLLEDIFDQFKPLPPLTDCSVEVKNNGNFSLTNFNDVSNGMDSNS